MKIYLENTHILPNHLEQHDNKENIVKNIYLTEYGKLEIYNNKSVLFKLENTTVEKVENFIDNFIFYFSQENWKKWKNMNHIPFNHTPLQIQYTNYKITEKLKYVIETVDDKIIDYYFNTTYTKEDFHLKDELNSFLIKYNNSN